MAKANSFKNQPWTTLEKGSYSITSDDFINEKLFTLKVNKKSATSGLAFKDSLSQKDGKIKTSEQLKIWFPFRETRTLYAVLKQDAFKLHFDGGNYTRNEFILNPYGSVQGSRLFGEKLVYKAGLQATRNNIALNLRVRFNSSDRELTLYEKASYATGAWRFGTINAINLAQKVWNYSGLQVGYKNEKGNDFFLRTNAGTGFGKVKIQSFFENLVLNYVHNFNSASRLGLQVAANLDNQRIGNASLTWDHKCSTVDNTGIKIKGDLKRTLNISVKNNIPSYGSYIFGVGVRDFGNSNEFSYGIQLDLNL